MLDATRLRVLVAIARHGSVTAAAQALNYAQPSISHHMARLESETGAKLMERAGPRSPAHRGWPAARRARRGDPWPARRGRGGTGRARRSPAAEGQAGRLRVSARHPGRGRRVGASRRAGRSRHLARPGRAGRSAADAQGRRGRRGAGLQVPARRRRARDRGPVATGEPIRTGPIRGPWTPAADRAAAEPPRGGTAGASASGSDGAASVDDLHYQPLLDEPVYLITRGEPAPASPAPPPRSRKDGSPPVPPPGSRTMLAIAGSPDASGARTCCTGCAARQDSARISP